jgi:large subunit ribosomal protein L18
MDKQIVKGKAIERKRRRIRKRVSGNAERPRLSVYRSEKHIYGQLIDDETGRTLIAASTVEKAIAETVKDLDPTAAAGKVGEAIAERAIAAGHGQVVFDRGGRRYGGRVAALADGARAKGLQF